RRTPCRWSVTFASLSAGAMGIRHDPATVGCVNTVSPVSASDLASGREGLPREKLLRMLSGGGADVARSPGPRSRAATALRRDVALARARVEGPGRQGREPPLHPDAPARAARALRRPRSRPAAGGALWPRRYCPNLGQHRAPAFLDTALPRCVNVAGS